MVDQVLYERLKEVAKAQRTVSYSEAAAWVDLDMSSEADRRAISERLDEISQHEHAQGRPLLSVVVVHGLGGESAGAPGKGFFALARQLGLHKGKDDVTFFATELTRTLAAWKGR